MSTVTLALQPCPRHELSTPLRSQAEWPLPRYPHQSGNLGSQQQGFSIPKLLTSEAKRLTVLEALPCMQC